VCAGKLGQPSLEDLVCGGFIIERLATRTRGALELNDGAVAAMALAGCMGDIGEVLRNCSHGVYLAALGFGEDLEFCARLDKYSSVPIVADSRISGRNASRQ
jgi:2-phosphosulfolactate phosphatase